MEHYTKRKMRRKDREITEFATIVEIIDECEIMRIGLADGDIPYIVPLNFAYTVTGDEVTDISFYIHGAVAGRKYELMKKLGKCAFEMDVAIELDCLLEEKDVTQRYKCVMGAADITFIEGDEKKRVVDEIIMARDERTRDFVYNEK